MNIYELITAENIRAIYENDENRPTYIGEAFFPNVRQDGLKFEFIKGKQGLPVALVSANFNTNVLYRDRIGLEALSGKLPFFKEAYAIDEETRQELLGKSEEFVSALIDRIFDDEVELLEGADVTAERMRMQLLSTGTITITENGVNKQYDYGFDQDKQFKDLEQKWSNPEAKPLDDLYKAIKAYKTTFKKKVTTVVMADVTFSTYLANDASVLSFFANASTPNLYPTDEEIKSFVERKLGVRLVLTDKQYLEARDFNGKPVPFYPEDRVTLLSTIDLGQTKYGTTPEEADLKAKQSKASSVAVTSKGVTITTWEEVDPVNVNTKVSQVCLPTCENIDTIYIMKVTE